MFKPFISIDLYSNEIGSSLRICIPAKPSKPCYVLVNSKIEGNSLLTLLINFFKCERIDLNDYRLNVLFANRNQMNELTPILLSYFTPLISTGLSDCKSLKDIFNYGNTPHVRIGVDGQKIAL